MPEKFPQPNKESEEGQPKKSVKGFVDWAASELSSGAKELYEAGKEVYQASKEFVGKFKESKSEGEEKAVEHPEPVKIPEEALRPEEEEVGAKEAFDVEKALETPGYWEFLQRHGAQPETLSGAELEKYYKAYETTGVYAGFYKDTIQKEAGLEMEDSEIRPALENYFVSQMEMPKENEKMAELLKEYKETPQIIASREQALGKLLGNKDSEQIRKDREEWQQRAEQLVAEKKNLEEDAEISNSMRGWRGLFNYRSYSVVRFIFLIKGSRPMEAIFGESEKAREIERANKLKQIEPAVWFKEALDKIPEIKKAQKEAEKAADRESILSALEQSRAALKEHADRARGLIFGEMFDPMKKILGFTSARLKEQLKEIANPKQKSLKKLKEGIALIEKLENSDVEYLEKAELGKFAKNINQLIERKVSMAIREKLTKIPIGETGPLGFIKKMEDNLEKLSSKDGEIPSDLIRKKLEAYIKMAVPPKGEERESFRAKKLAVKCLLIKWGY